MPTDECLPNARHGERIYPWEMSEQDPLLQAHLRRYHHACESITTRDTVVDAACGSGYGSALLAKRAAWVIGIDDYGDALVDAQTHYQDQRSLWFVQADLDQCILPACDVLVSLETVEHLRQPERFIQQVRACARREIILSTPIIPTVGKNPFHRSDFTLDQVRSWFTTDEWIVVQEWLQEDAAVDFGPVYAVVRARRRLCCQ